MIFRIVLTALGLLCGSLAWAGNFQPDLRTLDQLPFHTLPALSVAKSMARVQSKSQPLQFAVGVALPLGLDDGRWQPVDADTWSWRTRIYSSGAQTLNFVFSQFHLPAGGSLWIYDAAGQVIQGPYTEAQASADGRLWTAVIPGETAILEVRVPTASRDQVQLKLAQVNHGFRGFGKDTVAGLGLLPGGSGSCEQDVACPAGNDWPDEARSVARIAIGGVYLCSGELVNNVRQDDTPYFLTANHCEIGQTALTPPSSVVFYWNYQYSQCGGGLIDSLLLQNQVGSTLVAQDRASDFTLLKLNQTPSTSYKLFLSGWDAANDIPQSGAVIHHPQGDVKKISLYDSPASRQLTTLCDSTQSPCPAASMRTIGAWQVQYASGATEPGSSGAALFNQNHQIVGLLSGGTISCSTRGTDDYDYYGRIGLAWQANASAGGQLMASLDPDKTGALSLCGKNLGAAVCTNTIAPPTGSTLLPRGSTQNLASSGSARSSGGGGALPPISVAILALLAGLRYAMRRHRMLAREQMISAG
ncbi:MAG: trypsin-like serine peptidase [Stenotrophobium sp.]